MPASGPDLHIKQEGKKTNRTAATASFMSASCQHRGRGGLSQIWGHCQPHRQMQAWEGAACKASLGSQPNACLFVRPRRSPG